MFVYCSVILDIINKTDTNMFELVVFHSNQQNRTSFIKGHLSLSDIELRLNILALLGADTTFGKVI